MIGPGRQWRLRMAGLRVNALVSLGAGLFVTTGTRNILWRTAVQTRVSAQTVSDVRVLGVGVGLGPVTTLPRADRSWSMRPGTDRKRRP
ncbi:MgtC/SapB family protein [Curtobacterium sp. VKM Ac-2852]|uniref:MgtC/SapB family protein n=1 Tax=Curtobacterium sp. VKM Ac-2852 TaxID=2739024 RepID=UPI00156501B0|nr:MgtC/SapB family protein [Curtobacterium sp. VKM Ac-2852]